VKSHSANLLPTHRIEKGAKVVEPALIKAWGIEGQQSAFVLCLVRRSSHLEALSFLVGRSLGGTGPIWVAERTRVTCLWHDPMSVRCMRSGSDPQVSEALYGICSLTHLPVSMGNDIKSLTTHLGMCFLHLKWSGLIVDQLPFWT
jgi:hypothetical protein